MTTEMTTEQAIATLREWAAGMQIHPDEVTSVEQAVALGIEALEAVRRAERASTSSPAAPEPAKEEKDHGAGLIGANDTGYVGTLPRPSGGKRLRVFGPYECPDDPVAYLGDCDGDVSCAVDTLREYLTQMDDGDEIVFRVKGLTDAEVEALPDL